MTLATRPCLCSTNCPFHDHRALSPAPELSKQAVALGDLDYLDMFSAPEQDMWALLEEAFDEPDWMTMLQDSFQ
jgi:hypothetical protein